MAVEDLSWPVCVVEDLVPPGHETAGVQTSGGVCAISPHLWEMPAFSRLAGCTVVAMGSSGLRHRQKLRFSSQLR